MRDTNHPAGHEATLEGATCEVKRARWTASGTHTEPWGSAAPTGRHAEFSGVNIFRFGPTGKVIEIWNHRDDLGLHEQLGTAVYAGPPSDSQT